MMLESFRLFFCRSRISSLVDRIVARSHAAVWRRVRERVSNMGPHEARGYVRARAALVIDREMSIALTEVPQLSEHHWQHITDEVRQQLIRLILADSLRMQQARKYQTTRRAA